MPSMQDEIIYDLVGLGFGPANIAIAGALTEAWDKKISGSVEVCPIRKVLFIEKHPTFRWHPGMLLPEAKMQISFMKDLATLRNPQSPYTFLSYLHSQGRLVSFINRSSTVPTRKEYSDYLSWAAQSIQAKGVNVLYGHEIVEIYIGAADIIAIRYRNLSTGDEAVVQARNIVISPGGSPRIPAAVSSVNRHPHVVHSSAYATSIPTILETLSKSSQPLRIAVIGSGQSAAEVTLDLRARLSNIKTEVRHEIDVLIRKGCLKPSDDSPFANEVFDPATTDDWFALSSRRLRNMKLAEYKPTNYGVVNPRTLDTLYEVIYDQRLDDGIAHRTGNNQLRAGALINIKPYTSISSIKPCNEELKSAPSDLLLSPEHHPLAGDSTIFTITTQNMINQSNSEDSYNAIVYATGYERSSWVDLLKNSDIGRHFGLHPLSSDVSLVPLHSGMRPTQSKAFSSASYPPSLSSSADSTPPTSPELETFSREENRSVRQELFISRNYRLLPISTSDGRAESEPPLFIPRIYLQGVEEYTHGLSDTLLSVLGVRAGEVVADLCAGHI